MEGSGQNSIVVWAGANARIIRDQIDTTLQHFAAGDILLRQNEISETPYLDHKGRDQGLRICFNPAPCEPGITSYPLELVDILIVNETEGVGLAGPDTFLINGCRAARQFAAESGIANGLFRD